MPGARRYRTIERAYTEFDQEGKGKFTYEELALKLIGVGANFSQDTLVSLAADIDTDNDKMVSKVNTFLLLRIRDPPQIACFLLIPAR